MFGSYKPLIGLSITGIRYMTKEEANDLGWRYRPVVITLSDGTRMVPVQDTERNESGVLFTTKEECPVLLKKFCG